MSTSIMDAMILDEAKKEMFNRSAGVETLLMERFLKELDALKDKEKEAAKKKEDADKKKGALPSFSPWAVTLILAGFGPPVGLLWMQALVYIWNTTRDVMMTIH